MTMRSKQWYTKTSRLEYSFAKSSIGRRSSNRFLAIRSSDRRPLESKFQISLARHYVTGSYDFQGSNLMAYGGLIPVVTMLERLQFQELIEQHVTIQGLITSMPG